MAAEGAGEGRKKAETEQQLRRDRREQVAHQEHRLAVQLEQERQEFQRLLRVQQEQQEREERERRGGRGWHRPTPRSYRHL
ncbi:cilia- and flagella-associated protein 45-like [Pseudopipra pipra]|uniref:cilia- and flagella-associated protein 45-like n=1 Tax=Pseudopipra pipra TaxID=415032 RepID=UPI0031394C7A